MQLGIYLRELWERKIGLAIVLVVALAVAARIGFGASLAPPRLDTHALQLSSASTHMLVDTPQSSVLDLNQNTYNLTELSNRALLLGNLMASPPVRKYIAREAKIPAYRLRVSPPVTPEQPRAIADSAHQPSSTDILKSPEEYRLSVQSNPTVPVVDIYAEAPDSTTAIRLANSAVRGLRDYLTVLGEEGRTPFKDQVRLVQLGQAEGATIDRGAGVKVALLAFLITFGLGCVALLSLSRARRGWVETRESGTPQPFDGRA
jgi:hypothetical protein